LSSSAMDGEENNKSELKAKHNILEIDFK
jgi:hypothetical protein